MAAIVPWEYYHATIAAEILVVSFRLPYYIIMNILAKLQPVFILSAALFGLLLGRYSSIPASYTSRSIEIFLMLLLFCVFLTIDIKEISRSFMHIGFSITSLGINFIWTPVFAFMLNRLFLRDSLDIQIGFMMLLVTPCTDWYLIFTGMAKGNVHLSSSILPLNLILQIVLLPVYLLLFMHSSVTIAGAQILYGIVLVLVIPLVSANIVKLILKNCSVAETFETLFARYTDMIQLVFLCLAVAAMFASQGNLLLENPELFLTIFPPLIIFFIINFMIPLAAGKIVNLPFEDTISLVFTASARNSPVALAIATVTFPAQPVISLVLVIGPLIELPVLAIEAKILNKIRA